VSDTLDYLLSIGAIKPALAERHRAVVMSAGAAAVRDGVDSQAGGIFESGGAEAGPQSRLKVWWVQAEAMLALWKLHEHFGGSAGAGAAGAAANVSAGSTSSGQQANNANRQQQQEQQQQQQQSQQPQASSSSYYLRVLRETVRFVKERQTDSAGGGEQFWQVRVGVWCAGCARLACVAC
jgi:mannose/cellobiose epimerase-like protein (N-acyl-D-glucosamine 2-epimerase family)